MDQFVLSCFDTTAEMGGVPVSTHVHPGSEDQGFAPISFVLPEKVTGKIGGSFTSCACAQAVFSGWTCSFSSTPFQGLTMRSGPRESVVRAGTTMNRVKVVKQEGGKTRP